ncbi:VTT domain-containing protein [Sphingomonas sp. ST-64]|uniref:VTT domain-containing protein n=1 Tax=Sphingomonas plantiphila TaxID=3163295 RepID=A0ABW8YMH8_9SPHN
MDYLSLFLLAFGVNLLPAFGPPTWSIIVLYGINGDQPLWALVLIGAVGAALGRLALAIGARHFGKWLPRRMRDNIAAARIAVERRKNNVLILLALFVISPLPSAQLFMAVGLARVPLLGFTAAFFAGRLFTYAFYGWTARKVRESDVGEVLLANLTSPWGLALQVAMLGLLVALVSIDWGRWLNVSRDEVRDKD